MTQKLTNEQLQETIKAVESSYTQEEACDKLQIRRQALWLRLRSNGYKVIRGKLKVVKVK